MSQGRLHQRRSIRLAGYDYGSAGAYFVTIGTLRMRCVFGRVEEGVMRLNRYGAIVLEEWQRTAELRANVVLDEFVVMPNHFHAIVMLIGGSTATHGRAHCNAPLQRAPQSLPSLVSGFKGSVVRRINTYRSEHNLAPVHVWQRNYYERIIRDEKELNDTRRYIRENPLRWQRDEENPDATP